MNNKLVIIGIVVLALIILLLLVRRVSAKSSSSMLVFSMTLPQSLPGSVCLNARYYLPNYGVVFQLNPNGGDYAVLVTPSGVQTLPDNSIISQGTDYSNITGYSTIEGVIAFGGGEEASNPWSPCAAPCAPYVAFFQNGKLNIIKIPGGSCDNMNASAIVQGQGSDYVVIGGACPGTATGPTGYVIVRNGSIAGGGLIAMNDSNGNTLCMYRTPKITVNGNVYMIAQIANSNTAVLEYVPLSSLYNNASPNLGSVLCGNGNAITPTYVTTVVNDWNTAGVQGIYYANGNLYFLYISTSGYAKLAIINLSTYRVTVKQLVQGKYVTIANGYAYVSDGTTIYKFDLNGNLITSKSFNGLVLPDMNGYIIQFTNGLNAGSKINVYTPL